MKKLLCAAILLNLLAGCLLALLGRRNSDFVPPASFDVAKTKTPIRVETARTEAGALSSSQPETIGEQPASADFSPSIEITNRSAHHRMREQVVSMPLVFQDVDVAQLKLNRDQLEAISDLRQRFLDEVGGLEQNPGDPAYRERWLKSQPQIDDDLRGMIGVGAFQSFQIEAADAAERRGDVK